MANKGVSIIRRSRQLYSNRYLYPYWKRTFPIMRYENELSTVCPDRGIKHKTPGQQGKGAGFNAIKKAKDQKTQYQQYLRYLYPNVRGEVLSEKGKHPWLFEHRLDVVTYHVDWSRTKSSSRQDISHGHILVNGKKVNTPSYRLKIGDVIECSKSFAYRFGFTKPYYSSSEANHRIRTAIFLNPKLPCETSVCNVKLARSFGKKNSMSPSFRNKKKRPAERQGQTSYK